MLQSPGQRGWGCPRLNPSFDVEVETAIQKVIEEHPDYFDFRRARGGPWSYAIPPAGDDS